MKFSKILYRRGICFVLIVLFLFFCSSLMSGEKEKVVQPNQLAGRWYPGSSEALRNQIGVFFAAADVNAGSDVAALILPHAGYQYSGQTAAFGVKRASGGTYERIVIIGPSHYFGSDNLLSLPAATHYSTPLGEVALDVELIEKLKENKLFTTMPLAHLSEHSVQIEIPLLQYAFGNFKLVPIVTGQCSKETIKKAAEILKGLIDDKTLVVASSDFTHYGPNYGYVPFATDVPENLKNLDMGAFEHISELDSDAFIEYKQKTGATICGFVPIAILLEMQKAGTETELVKYTTSGELMGDFSNSVSYMAVAFHKKGAGSKETKGAESTGLSEEEKKQLLVLARKSLEYYLENRIVPKPDDLGFEPTEVMKQKRAAFVTLKKENHLRGCIGDVLPRVALYQSVIENAVNAGVNDYRFMPVMDPEVKSLNFEISVLTVPKQVESPNDIRIGTDGVIFEKDGRSALFLPQVAPQEGWDLEQMLGQLSVKAGLASNAWRQGGKFYTFQAVVFGEAEQ